MSRLRYPEPDRWYIPVFESIEFIMDSIRKGLMLDTDDPVPNFRGIVKQVEQLNKLVHIAAIQQERKENLPIIFKRKRG